MRASQRVLALALSALLAIATPGLAQADPPDGAAPVAVSDPQLRACLETALGLAAGTALTAGMTQGLTQLDCSAPLNEWGDTIGAVADLSGLDGFDFSSLTSLDLGPNHLEQADLTVLTRLHAPNLATLDLSSNWIWDIAPIAPLTGLTSLNLAGNVVSDIRPLRLMTRLGQGTRGVALDLSGNALLDLSALATLPELSPAEVRAADQVIDLVAVGPGTYPYKVRDADGSIPAVTQTTPTDATIDATAGTITIRTMDAFQSWSNASGSFSGSSAYIFSPNAEFTPPTPAASYTLDADVLVVAGSWRDVFDTGWLSNEMLRAKIDAGAAAWTAETGVSVTYNSVTVKRLHIDDYDTCHPRDLNGINPIALAQFGATQATYRGAGSTRTLFVIYDFDTCDLAPQYGGFADTLGQTSFGLGHGGIIYLPAHASPNALAHELGHTFGLAHANRRVCPSASGTLEWVEPAAPYAVCTQEVYRDVANLMGFHATSLLGVLQKFHFGIVRDGAGAAVFRGEGEWTVTLGDVHSTTGVQGAVVSPVYSLAGFEAPAYGIEFRQEEVTEYGIHQAAGVYVTYAELIGYAGQLSETELLQPNGAPYDQLLPLPPGTTFTLADGQIEVTTLSVTATSATVRITSRQPLHRFDTPTLVVNSNGGTVTTTITSELPWRLTEYPDWVTPSITRGPAGTTTISFTAAAGLAEARSGTLAITVDEELAPATAVIQQDASLFALLRFVMDRLRELIERLLAIFA